MKPHIITSMGMLSLSYLIIILGMTGNFIAMQNNQGLMPVLSMYNYETNEHFSFQNPDEVDKYFFVDRFKINHTIYSIGDFVMIFGIINMLIFTGFIVSDIRRYKKGKLIIEENGTKS
jgi:hypothetical protein